MTFIIFKGGIIMSHINLYNDIGSRLRAFRKAKNITLQTLSMELNRSIATLSKYETGEIAVGIDALLDICTFLDIDISSILPETQAKATSEVSLSEGNDTHQLHQQPLFLYWFNKEEDAVVEAVIEHREKSTESILYHGCSKEGDYRKSKGLYTGTSYHTSDSSEFLYFNVSMPHDKVYIRLPSFIRKNQPHSHMGIMSCGTTHHPNAALKILATKTRIRDLHSLRESLTCSQDEIRTLKRTNFFVVDPTE